MKNGGKILTALLTGLAAGTVIGVLFAPEKGSDTRDKLNESLADLSDAIKERAEEQLDQFAELKDKLFSVLKSKAAKAEQAIDEEIEEHA